MADLCDEQPTDCEELISTPTDYWAGFTSRYYDPIYASNTIDSENTGGGGGSSDSDDNDGKECTSAQLLSASAVYNTELQHHRRRSILRNAASLRWLTNNGTGSIYTIEYPNGDTFSGEVSGPGMGQVFLSGSC